MTPLEMKQRLLALEARVKVLESAKPAVIKSIDAVAAPIVVEVVKSQEAQPAKNMCPKCGEKPNRFFHVKSCTGKKTNNAGSEKETLRPRAAGAS